jgi:murein DD-endopeptidase MepM/ murein hydrolase activator NlpD
MANLNDAIQVTPTRTASSLLRGHEGAFHAPRGGGKVHQGVDIVANKSSADKSIYEVRTTAIGKVAYARMNGSATTGYGYTVVVDHQNGWYTLYAHLAINASAGLKSVGDSVSAGDVIGYLADLANGEKSSGNARAVAPYDKIQLHFECFQAPPGRSSANRLDTIRVTAATDDPSARLQALGYQSF